MGNYVQMVPPIITIITNTNKQCYVFKSLKKHFKVRNQINVFLTKLPMGMRWEITDKMGGLPTPVIHP